LSLLVGRQEGHPAWKKLECWHVGGGDLTGALHVFEFRLSLPPPPSYLAAEKPLINFIVNTTCRTDKFQALPVKMSLSCCHWLSFKSLLLLDHFINVRLHVAVWAHWGTVSKLWVPCGLRGCKNWPAPFPGRMSYKATYVLLVFVAMCSVFLLFWLSYQYLSSDWLERLFWGSLIVARGSSPESPGRSMRMIFLVYSIASLFYYVFVSSPAPTWYILTCCGTI